jgi:hypothetical protein
MPAIEAKYSPEQREAIAVAWLDLAIRPARRVVAMAAAGELELNGEKLPPFETRVSTVADFARKLRQRRAGTIASEVEKLGPRDAVEALHRRLTRLADAELAALEKTRAGKRDPERIRQIARAVVEIARIPDPTTAPVPKVAPKATGPGSTAGGLAGAVLAAHGQGSRPRSNARRATAQDVRQTHTPTERTARSTERTDQHHAPAAEEPGAWVRAQYSAVLDAPGGDTEHLEH